MRLLDKTRNQIANISDNLVNEALKTGNYETRPGVRLPVTLPDGTHGELDSEEMSRAVSLGVRYRTIEDDKEIAKQQISAIKKEAYDKPLMATALGVARGATFGLSDVGLSKVGYEESISEIQYRSKDAWLVGSSIGMGTCITLLSVSIARMIRGRYQTQNRKSDTSSFSVNSASQAAFANTTPQSDLSIVEESADASPQRAFGLFKFLFKWTVIFCVVQYFVSALSTAPPWVTPVVILLLLSRRERSTK
jgi:hypothetical protein